MKLNCFTIFAALVFTAITFPTTQAAPAQQAYLKASNTGLRDGFGWSVALSGDTMVVGTFEEDSSSKGVNGNQSDNSATGSGAAYVFVRDGTNWSQQGYLKASNTEGAPSGSQIGDWFGYSVAASGDTIVVGARFESSNATGVNGDQTNNSALASGAAYVFVRNGTNWSQQAYLKASNTGQYDDFGVSVSVSGDTIVVGADQESSKATGVNGDQSDNSAGYSGATYVFVRNGTNWSQQAYLKASNTEVQVGSFPDFFGASVSVWGDSVVVGAYGEDSNATGVNGDQTNNNAPFSGAAYVFVRNGTNWSQQAYLKASNTGVGDNFGYRLAMEGDTVVVGAHGESSNATGVNGNQSDNGATNSGAAYVFVRNGTNWGQQAYLKASNTGQDDLFGRSVSVSGNTVVVGAYFESSSATGVNGNQLDDSATNSGAGYLFARSGTNWRQRDYLKASNTEAGDIFGWSVAVSGDTIVVGSIAEDSNSTGVNGDQSDNSVSSAGAAYVFTGFCPSCPQLELVPDGSGAYFLRFDGTPGITYRLQRAPNVTGPWDTIDTQTASASGLIEYHETNGPQGVACYRAVQP